MVKRSFWRRIAHALTRDDTADMRRDYDGAKTGRRTDGWLSTSSSADAEIGGAIATMRDRARDLDRNNPTARRIFDVMTALVIGDGIVGSPNTGDPELDKRVTALWNEFVENCDAEGDHDFYGMQSLVFRSMLVSGEVLTRRRTRYPTDGLTVPLQLQVVEPDLIDGSRQGIVDGYLVRLGVQYDQLDRRSGYYLFKQHPGDVAAAFRRFESSLVPAETVAHLFLKTRPGQSRGVTWIAPVMVALRDLGDMQDAMLFREKLNACFTGFIERDAGWEGEPDAETDATGRSIDAYEPGMLTNLRPGEKYTKAETPGADSKYTEFVSVSKRDIAVGSGATYDQLTSDMTQANFSSLKAGDRIQRRMITAMQWQLVIPYFCERVKEWFIDTCYLKGLLPAREGGYPFRWLPPAHEYIDKQGDLDADILEMSVGGKTWSQFIQERGWDPSTQAEELAADKKLLATLGIDLGQVLTYMTARQAAVASQPDAQSTGQPRLRPVAAA